MKKILNTKFGQFLTRIVGKIPELASDIGEIMISPNPVGVGIGKLLGKLKEKSATDDRYRIALIELEQNRMDWEKEIFQAEMDDRKDARLTYREKNGMADRIAKSIISWNLAYIGVLVIVNITCIIYLDKALLAIISNIIGMVLQLLINERLTVVNFFFGSSLGSKLKDKPLIAEGNEL